MVGWDEWGCKAGVIEEPEKVWMPTPINLPIQGLFTYGLLICGIWLRCGTRNHTIVSQALVRVFYQHADLA